MDLAKFLVARGYLSVQLERSKSGLLEVLARVEGTPATLYLDTGAGRTCFDRASAQRLGLATRQTDHRAAGLGVADQAVSYAALRDFWVGACRLGLVDAVVIDFTHVNTAREQLGDRPFDGVLGSDVLVARAAVLDYGNLMLYLREGAREEDVRAERAVAPDPGRPDG